MLVQATSLAHLKPDDTTHFMLRTDTSQTAVGAMLQQVHDDVTEPLFFRGKASRPKSGPELLVECRAT